jgi:phospholipase C
VREYRLLAAGIAALLVVAAVIAVSVRLSAGTPRTAAPDASSRTSASSAPGAPARIKHVIEVMLENHTFDNLFGTFAGADGIPSGATLPGPSPASRSARGVHPVFAAPNEGDVMNALDNGRGALQTAMDYVPGQGYRMDHFAVLPADSMASITEFGPRFDPDQQYLARHYELADHNFQPLIGPTMPNVMAALNGTAHGWFSNSLNPDDTQPWNSIFDELTAAGRSWKIYYALPLTVLDGTLWEKIIPPGHEDDITPGDQFFTDIADGQLPDFSFVRPGVGYSGEAEEDLGNPDAWIGQLVSSVAHSQYWSSTAIFVSYDEGGGFWDHVAPSAASGYGTRTPLTIISPYARAGIYHQPTTNISILSFMQKMWGLSPLTPLNRSQNDLMSAFDFGQAPLPAPVLPVAPADTLAFHGPGGILTNIAEPGPGKPVSISLWAETPGLSLDSGVSGTVRLSVTPPSGVAVPAAIPASVSLTGGQANFTLTFPVAGYYRVAATGPDGSVGWATVDVGTTPATPPQ